VRGVRRLPTGQVPALRLRATARATMDPKLSELGKTEASGDDAQDAVPLTRLPTGRHARIVRVVHDHDGHWRKLSALGIMPGATVYLMQRIPTYAVRVGMSTVAVDTQLAQLIWVAPL